MHEGGSRGRLAEARPTKSMKGLGFRVDRGSNYPIIRYLGFGVIITLVQILGKYMIIIRCLDPQGKSSGIGGSRFRFQDDI